MRKYSHGGPTPAKVASLVRARAARAVKLADFADEKAAIARAKAEAAMAEVRAQQEQGERASA